MTKKKDYIIRTYDRKEFELSTIWGTIQLLKQYLPEKDSKIPMPAVYVKGHRIKLEFDDEGVLNITNAPEVPIEIIKHIMEAGA